MPVTPAPLLLIAGEEQFLVDRDARAWLRAAREASLSDLDVEVIEAPAKLDGLRRSLGVVPFLADVRHVLVRDPPQLAERARRGADSAEDLAAALDERSPATAVCVVSHHRMAPSNPVVALARRTGRVADHPRLRFRDLRAAADRLVAERGLRLPRGAVEYIVGATDGDLATIDMELTKIAAFVDGGAPPTLEAVQRLVAGSETLATWDVLERLLAVPHARGAAAVEALLADGTSAQYLATVLAGQLRELLLAHDVLDRGGGGSGAVAAELGLPPWRADRLARWARVAPPELVEEWLRALQRLDADLKLGLIDDAARLRSVVLRAARSLEERRRAGRV